VFDREECSSKEVCIFRSKWVESDGFHTRKISKKCEADNDTKLEEEIKKGRKCIHDKAKLVPKATIFLIDSSGSLSEPCPLDEPECLFKEELLTAKKVVEAQAEAYGDQADKMLKWGVVQFSYKPEELHAMTDNSALFDTVWKDFGYDPKEKRARRFRFVRGGTYYKAAIQKAVDMLTATSLQSINDQEWKLEIILITDGKPADCRSVNVRQPGRKDTTQDCAELATSQGITLRTLFVHPQRPTERTVRLLSELSGCSYFRLQTRFWYVGMVKEDELCPNMRIVVAGGSGELAGLGYTQLQEEVNEFGPEALFFHSCPSNPTPTSITSTTESGQTYPGVPEGQKCEDTCKNYLQYDKAFIIKKWEEINSETGQGQISIQITYAIDKFCNCSFQKYGTTKELTIYALSPSDVSGGTIWNQGCVEWGPSGKREIKCPEGDAGSGCRERVDKEKEISGRSAVNYCQIHKSLLEA
jgi:hypothetical protein